MMPMVTLHHFSSPRWLPEKGGWLADDIVPRFERFAAQGRRRRWVI